MIYRVLLPFQQQPQQPQVKQRSIRRSAVIYKSFISVWTAARTEMECGCCFSPSSPLSLPPVPPPLLHQKAEEDVFAFGQRQDVRENLLRTPSPLARFRWWDAKSAGRPTAGPWPGLTPSWTGFAYSDHAWNRPGGRPKSHFATPQASSSPPVLTGHGETLRPRSTATATTASHRATVHSHRRSRLRHHPPPLPLKRLAGS